MDRQRDRQTDVETDGQTDRQLNLENVTNVVFIGGQLGELFSGSDLLTGKLNLFFIALQTMLT